MIDDSPPRPPNMPPPNSMPSRPAPRKPAARPPSMPMPGRLKKPPLAAPAPAAIPGLPGWVMVRLNGCAAFGAVEVLGGAEKVRDPREPELPPPPIRASAAETASITGTASDRTIGDRLDDAAHTLREIHGCSLIPRQGEAPLRWALVPKSEAPMTTQGCGARSRVELSSPGRSAARRPSRSGALQSRDRAREHDAAVVPALRSDIRRMPHRVRDTRMSLTPAPWSA